MPDSSSRHQQTTFAAIADAMRNALKRIIWPIAILAMVEVGVLFMKGSPAVTSFFLISFSSLATLSLWAKYGEGLPMLALLAGQNLIIYGLPIVAANESAMRYPADFLTKAGWEVFAFNLAMVASWRVGMTFINRSSPLCYALLGLDSASPKLTRLGMALLLSGTAYELLDSTSLLSPLLGSLPAGSNSIIHALMSATSACGFFLCGLMVGKGLANPTQRALFWFLIALQCFITAAGFLLSAAILIVFASAIGLFWGSGKIPWRYLVSVFLIFAFLNIGKFAMREKYWSTEEGDQAIDISLLDMPNVYREWAGESIDILTGNAVVQAHRGAFAQIGESEQSKIEGQSLLDRVNNLENLLYVIDVMQTSHIPPLNGATYAVIPPLLVPRILWPNKPRTHEGQIMLNVYFGRQDINSTLRTYIAWGLLPEAYGNFGPITGAVILGLFLGVLFAWIEKFIARKLVLSLEGFLCFMLFLGTANSYEMVASVLVTSLFQAFVPIVIASAPFIERILPQAHATKSKDAAPSPHVG